jgi:hypothetical protein
MFRTLSITSLLLLVASSAFAQERPSNGRFVRGAGETPAKLTRAGSKSAYLGTDPYSGSYLPRTSGPLANEPGDQEIKKKITEGFQNGECNLVHKIIQDNANKDAAAKLDGIGNPGFRERYLREGHNPQAESWEGFCHNWAPAGLDPAVNFMVSMDKIYADVPFGVSDLRELTTFTLPDTWDVAWFGKRHNDKDSAEKPEDSLDPVDLMTIFENYVGEGKPGIVLDVDPGYMVWNQPFYKWNRTATRVQGADMGPKKPPAGGRAYKVKLDATYGVEGNYGYRGETLSRESNWEFFIYTDKKGNIVDSAWDPSASNKIPDFAWAPKGQRQDSPEFDALKKIAKDGVKVSSIEEFCKTMAGLSGKPSRSERKKLKKLLDEICPVLDQNKLSDYIRKTAERIGVDYSVLEDSIRVDVEAHI